MTFKLDILIASKMNLKPKEKQLKMRDMIFGLNNKYQLIINNNGKSKKMK